MTEKISLKTINTYFKQNNINIDKKESEKLNCIFEQCNVANKEGVKDDVLEGEERTNFLTALKNYFPKLYENVCGFFQSLGVKTEVRDDSTASPKVKQFVKEIAEGKRRLGDDFEIPNETNNNESNVTNVQSKIDSEEKVYYLLGLFEDFDTGMPNYTLSKADRQYIYDAIMNSQFIKENPSSEVAKEYIEYAKEAISNEYMNREETVVYR